MLDVVKLDPHRCCVSIRRSGFLGPASDPVHNFPGQVDAQVSQSSGAQRRVCCILLEPGAVPVNAHPPRGIQEHGLLCWHVSLFLQQEQASTGKKSRAAIHNFLQSREVPYSTVQT